MKSLYLCNGELVDNYETLEEAILKCIAHWHEDQYPWAYVIRDEESLIAATICPVGSDAAVVVYSGGDIHKYDGITYVKRHGEYYGTRFFFNGSATPTILN